MQVQLSLPLGLAETPEEIFWRVYSEIRVKSRRALSVERVLVAWRSNGSSIGTVRVRSSLLEVSLSDVVKSAPPDVVEALAEILIAKLFRRGVPAEYRLLYKTWLHRGDTREQLDALRRRRGFKRIDNGTGRHYSLDAIFDQVNARYFEGRMARPTLAWSKSSSRTHWGHWDAAHQTIVLSRALDAAEVPATVVEYVMFHEMLHIVHPVEHEGGRRRIHTRPFKADEKRYAELAQVRAFLRRFASGLLSF